MASGRLATSNPAANTITLLYTVPSNKIASFNLSAVNMGNIDAAITVYITDSSTTDSARLIENNLTLIKFGGVLERGGLLASAGEKVYISCSSSNIAVRLYGYED